MPQSTGVSVAGAVADSAAALHADSGGEADLERRFGGLRRLYGDAGYARVRAASCVVVGVGGVGSWAAEALARSGVAALTLFDLDHVAESNINRQLQALGATLGKAKVEALCERLVDIHPGCRLLPVESFVEEDNWPGLLGTDAVDVVVDACDDGRAKTVLARWALASGVPLVVVGAAGGKRPAQAAMTADLAEATHDPILAALRQRLRKLGVAPRAGRIGLPCVFSREPVQAPADACEVDGSLNCHGYGSTVTVTATFGMVAAGLALEALIAASHHRSRARQRL